jgi:hypothetical protein
MYRAVWREFDLSPFAVVEVCAGAIAQLPLARLGDPNPEGLKFFAIEPLANLCRGFDRDRMFL